MAKKEAGNAMERAAATLFPDDAGERAAFLGALRSPSDDGNAVAWTCTPGPEALATVPRGELPDWLPETVDLLRPDERADPSLASEGHPFYSLDFSSVLAASPLLAARGGMPAAPRVLDLCAAPGGKSVLVFLFLGPGFLLANEVVGKRLAILRHNLGRCRVPRAHTQRLQPSRIAELAPDAFDACLVDAPCSGQSLLARGRANPGCFHPPTIKGNARRQRRILAAGADTVRAGGFVLYSTCTFSRRENEGVIESFLESRPDFEPMRVAPLDDLRSPHSRRIAYRFHPHRQPGAGGFTCLMRRRVPDSTEAPTPAPLPDELLAYPVDDASGSPAEEPAS